MTDDIVVLGSGYAGTGAIKRLESELDGEADLTWVSDVDHHLVLHESHRCIRNPDIRDRITFDISEIKSPATRFVQGRVDAIDTDDRIVTLADGSTVAYDYLLVGFGSKTAFFGVDGLVGTRPHAQNARGRSRDPRRGDRGGPGGLPERSCAGRHRGGRLSGIQSAGEIAEYRDKHRAPLEIHLVEGLDNVFPNNDPVVQAKLRKLLEAKDVEIHTGEFIGEVDEDTVYVGDDAELDYDVLLWTGGITGQDAAETADVDKDERSNRIESASTFRTSNERVFALGDAALIDQPGRDNPAPPTAQAAWQAAEVAGENIAREIRGEPLTEWTHDDKGTLISVGSKAVAHDVKGLPIDTFGGPAAKALKKTVAARWINTVTGVGDAARAFPDM